MSLKSRHVDVNLEKVNEWVRKNINPFAEAFSRGTWFFVMVPDEAHLKVSFCYSWHLRFIPFDGSQEDAIKTLEDMKREASKRELLYYALEKLQPFLANGVESAEKQANGDWKIEFNEDAANFLKTLRWYCFLKDNGKVLNKKTIKVSYDDLEALAMFFQK